MAECGHYKHITNDDHDDVLDDKHEIVTVDTGYKVYMKLHIKNIKRSDIAEYRCVAKNSLGHSDGSISLYRNNSTELHQHIYFCFPRN